MSSNSKKRGRPPKLSGNQQREASGSGTSKDTQIENFFGLRKKETDDEKTKPKRTRSSTSSGSTMSLIKRMKENKRELEEKSGLDDEDETDIPESLGNSVTERTDPNELPKAVLEVDKLLESEEVMRIRAEDDLSIQLICPLFARVGSLGRVFRLDNAAQMNSDSIPDMSLLDLLILSAPASRLRSILLERLNFRAASQRANGNGFRLPFDNLYYLICYAFQVDPASLQIFSDDSKEKQFANRLKNFTKAFSSLLICDHTLKLKRLHGNMHFLLSICWPYLSFSHFEDEQLISLFSVLSCLYLDEGTRFIWSQLTRAIQMIANQLSSERANTLLSQFINSSFMCVAEQCPYRSFTLFQLFNHLPQFAHQHRLLAIYAMLKSIMKEATEDSPTLQKLSLADALALFPEAVSVLRASDETTKLFVVYKNWVDGVTVYERDLLAETEASLEQTRRILQDAYNRLNRRNINEKMVETWSLSPHRINEAIRNKQRLSAMCTIRKGISFRSLSSSSSDEEQGG